MNIFFSYSGIPDDAENDEVNWSMFVINYI